MKTEITPFTSFNLCAQLGHFARRTARAIGLLTVLNASAALADVVPQSGTFLTGVSGDKFELLVNGSLSTVQVSALTRISTCLHHVSGTVLVASIADGSSNIIKFGPTLSLTLQVGTSVGNVPINLIRDGTSNTIFIPENVPDSGCFAGETEIINLGSTPLDGSTNTLTFGELSSFDICFRSARFGRIVDGTSNTIQIGEVETNPVCFSDVRLAPAADAGGTIPEPGSAALLLLGLGLLSRASRKAATASFWRSVLATVGLAMAFNANAYVTFGQTHGISHFFEFKWGESSAPGTPGGTVTYSFLPRGTDCLLHARASGFNPRNGFCRADDPAAVYGPSYESIFASAFDAWSQWANIDFIQVADDGTPSGRDGLNSSTGTIRIGAADIQERIVLGTGFANFRQSALDGDIWLNSRFGRLDLAFPDIPKLFTGLILHEIGHTLGLAHSDVAGSVMFEGVGLLDTLQPDDIAGIQAIYGLRQSQEVPEPGALWLVLGALSMLGLIVRRNKKRFVVQSSQL